MAIAPLPSIAGVPQAGGVLSVGQPASSGGTFARVLGQFLGQVGQQNAHAEQAVSDLALGQTDNLHNVVLEVSKADLAFRLFLEIRNRLSDAYQEVMKMQV
jgi:flagellar hook-basal body complex protein FliE